MDTIHFPSSSFYKKKQKMILIEILYFIVFLTVVNFLTGFKRTGILGCGLVGFSGKNPLPIDLLYISMFYNSLTRGKHATGVFTPKTGVVKIASDALSFITSKEPEKIDTTDTLFMGHVRHATVGDITDPNNAHPWDFGDIVMMHNGTLKNFEKMATDYGLVKDTQWKVDSQVLGLALQKDFQNNTPFKSLSEYTGAAAVIMYHKERESIFVYRDDERPLFYGYNADGDMMMSSLDEILLASGLVGVKSFESHKVYEIKDGKILSKTIIKRRKAKRNNIISKIITNISQILKYRVFSSEKILLTEKNAVGFTPALIKPEYTKGYALRCTAEVAPNSPLSKLSKNKYYRISIYQPNGDLSVIGDNNISGKAFITMFDTSNFIPIPGSYVMLTANHTTYTSLKKDEIYEVVDHKFGSNDIIIKDHQDDTNYEISISSCRKLSYAEESEYFKGTESVTEATVITLPAVVNKDDITKLTIVEDKEIGSGDESESEDDEEEVDIDELMRDNTMLALGLIGQNISKVIEDTASNPNLPIEDSNVKELKTIYSFIKNCIIDDKFILNMNDNSFNNMVDNKK